MNTKRIGIIDLGSNSSRLVIYEIYQDGSYHVIFEMKRNIRLAQHFGEDMRISPEGIARAVTSTKLFTRAGHLYGVSEWISVATAAVRQAENRVEILETLQRETGLAFRVLQGHEEGRYGYLGVVNTIDVQDALLFDIGGASTELMYVKNRKLENVISLPYGAVNLTERFKDVPNVS